MSESEEIAKAIQESAKFGVKGLETAEKAGSFFAKVFQQPAYEISGMITDKLRFVRWTRAVKMMDEVTQILDERGIQNPRPVPPKIALPIFEEASLEDEGTLQDLWNNLLANAMDPEFNDEIRYGFIDMIKNLTGIDVIILQYCYSKIVSTINLERIDTIYQSEIEKSQIISKLGISELEYSISVENLMRLRLVNNVMIMGNGVIDIYMTPLGIKFVRACIK